MQRLVAEPLDESGWENIATDLGDDVFTADTVPEAKAAELRAVEIDNA